MQCHPAYSPSGLGIAYFSLFYQDLLTGSVGAQASLIVANADGTNPTTLSNFAPGFLPTGLTWTADGSQIIVSLAPQTNLGTGFLNSTVSTQSVIRAISTSNGAVTQLPAIDGGLTPQIAVNAAPPLQNLSNLTPTLSNPGDGLVIRAVGLDPLRNLPHPRFRNTQRGLHFHQCDRGATPGWSAHHFVFSEAIFPHPIFLTFRK